MSEQQYSRVQHANEDSDTKTGLWRSEIQDRVAGYKRRRGRRIEGAFSMRFPFPALEPSTEQPKAAEPVLADDVEEVIPGEPQTVTASSEIVSQVSAIEEDTPEPSAIANLIVTPEDRAEPAEDFSLASPERVEEMPAIPAAPRPRARRKVIAFPRQSTLTQENAHVLADPVLAEQPRILDVPEELAAVPTTPFLDGLEFQPNRQEHTAAAPAENHEQLPYPPAPGGRRCTAALIDMALTIAACGLTCVVAYRMLVGSLIVAKPLLLGTVLIPAVLWGVYQYLFLIHAGRTIGMRMTGIHLRTFKGEPVRRSQRRVRVIGLYLSAMSLGMGVLWAFVDLDALCWQDRISGTYPVAQ